MGKARLLVAGSLLLFGSVAHAEDAQLIAETVAAGIGCAVATGEERVDTLYFAGKPGWTQDAVSGTVTGQTGKVVIAFAKDPDGVVRSCEATAKMASQADQDQVLKALQVLLRKTLVDGQPWQFATASGPRNLTIIPDRISATPAIRFVSKSSAGTK
ncbi:hypothetical protein [Sphingomonas astaxanthinifaciens]|uniref:CreA protein n=1 Tax=Sphingomonas astaxanthinifaciens DSM 22298 TaxID=1123267 RepID=A0ABQ5Z647_9SPHN|nr:hypothetical protein [Sphingomonas astaxanthinifaciens]GLR47496.1 hypothetical protein GCM10007925_12080 [Sphingomonas astaxanthinifaciens DSM 22298]